MTSILDSLPTYIMSCFPLAKQDIEKYNKKRRSFFWTAEDTCTGAQCLVAWDRVCTPKSAGGLGVKNLEIQNGCLLLKFAYKFLHSADLPWKNWILHHSPYPMHQTSHSTFLASIVKKHIHILRQISQCTIGNGRSTYFWLDRWLLPDSRLFRNTTRIADSTTHPGDRNRG